MSYGCHLQLNMPQTALASLAFAVETIFTARACTHPPPFPVFSVCIIGGASDHKPNEAVASFPSLLAFDCYRCFSGPFCRIFLATA